MQMVHAIRGRRNLPVLNFAYCLPIPRNDRFSHVLHGKQPCSYLFSAENLERGMNYLMGLIENDPVPFIRQVTLV